MNVLTYNKEMTERLLRDVRTKQNIEELIELNIGLVRSQLSSFNLLHDHDALSFALEGLYKAIITYDANSTAAFSSYAVVCIKNSIRQSLRNRKEPVVIVSLECTIETEELHSAFINTEHAETIVINIERVSRLKEVISELLSAEGPSSRKVIEYWINSDFKALNQTIADKLCVSQPYVNKVINRFRNRLQNRLQEV